MIVIVTKNTDTFNNPTLFGLFYYLDELQIPTTLICERNYFSSQFKYNKIIIWQQPNFYAKRVYITAIRVLKNIKNYFLMKKYVNKVHTIIGIDPEGIIWANQLRTKYFNKASLDYFSFEIFWAKHFNHKADEINACKNLRNLIIQDTLREGILRKENLLSTNITSYLIPVAVPQLKNTTTQSNSNVRQKFNIDDDKKLILFFGSFDDWSGGELIYELIAQNKIPNNYVLIIHSRYPLNPNNNLHKKVLVLAEHNKQLKISVDYIASYQDTIAFIQQFNLGLVLYQPNYEYRYIGDNIYHIGLASGKFAQFMQAALPVITSNLPTYVTLNQTYNFGFTISNINDIHEVLTKEINYNLLSANAQKLFKERIDPTEVLKNYINQNLVD